MEKAKRVLKGTKNDILENIKQKLNEVDKKTEIYFHDIIHEEIDSNTPTDRHICLNLIDTADTSYFDRGLIDESSLDRELITMAYCSIEQNLFNDDFIQKLQGELNNEKISKKQAKKLIKEIEQEQEKYKPKKKRIKDNSTQVFIETAFGIDDLSKKDFKHLKDEQVYKNPDSIKILTSNNTINENAIVIQEYRKRNNKKYPYVFRVYLMEKDKDLDIRNLFKLKVISEDTGYILSPQAYTGNTTEGYNKERKRFKRNYRTRFKERKVFSRFIEKIAVDLTEKSKKEIQKKENPKVVNTK